MKNPYLKDFELASAVMKLICIGKDLDENFSKYETLYHFTAEMSKDPVLKNRILESMHEHFHEMKLPMPCIPN